MIKPRCLLYDLPIYLSADQKLKPCCFVNPADQWKDFLRWGKENKLDVEYDLDVTKHTIEIITTSPTWLAILDGFKTGNAPSTCFKECGPSSYSSTTQTAKHSDYKQDSSGNTSIYKEE
jgi:hypothetical protein